MHVRIEHKPAFHVVGFSKRIHKMDKKNFIEIPTFWETTLQSGKVKHLMDAVSGLTPNGFTKGVHGMMNYKYLGDSSFPYLIGAFSKTSIDGYESVSVPAGRWAVFTTKRFKPEHTVKNVQPVWHQIYEEWFNTTDYDHAGGAELEVYLCHEDGTQSCEIWIPII